MSEEWRPVVGVDAYDVSSEGRVRSHRKLKAGEPMVLKPVMHSTGRYYQVNVWNRTRLVHQLVAEAFIGPRPTDQEVCHGPAGSFVNTVENLSWGTRDKQHLDQIRDDTVLWGERNTFTKITTETVIQIRELAAVGMKHREIADLVGCSRRNVTNVINRVSWRHIGSI